MTVWKNTYHSSLIQTPETYPDLVNQLLSWSFCLPWHHSIAWLANNKSANHYLSCPGPSLRQYRPPPGALQPNYSLWRTTASGLHCSCWLQKHTTARVGRKEGRKVYNRVNEQVRHFSLFLNMGLHFYEAALQTQLYLCTEIKIRQFTRVRFSQTCLKTWGDNGDSVMSNYHCATQQGVSPVKSAVNSFSIRAT